MGMGQDREFDRRLREVLDHLFDFAYLQRHPFAARFAAPQAAATQGQTLRRILLDAIEALNPGGAVPRRSPERRAYAILFGLYVEGRTQADVARSLAVGARQLRRDRAAAFRTLSTLLAAREHAGTSEVPGEPLCVESQRAGHGRRPVDLNALVSGLLPLLAGMARGCGAELSNEVDSGLPRPLVNRTLLRQALIGLATQALESLPVTRLAFVAGGSETEPEIGLRLECERMNTPRQERWQAIACRLHGVETIAATLGGSLRLEPLASARLLLWLRLPPQDRMVVLVVDDNLELFTLFERYAARQPYRLVHAGSSDEALELARSLRPGAITLDLMMPERDGWEVLQSLRADTDTARIPVIVCSVLDEAPLARSLGVHRCLKKPVEQTQLLAALEGVRMQAAQGGGHPEGTAGTSVPRQP